jgi:hypothetical protein
MMSGLRYAVWYLSVLMVVPSLVQASIWQDINPPGLAAKGIDTTPRYYRALQADQAQLKQILALAPREDTSSQGATITLPMPQGDNRAFELEESPVLAPSLAAKYPEITTYRVRGIDDPSITGRLDMTPRGFHAMLSTPTGTVFIDPDDNGSYRSFYKQDYAAAMGGERQPVCRMSELPQVAEAETTTLPTLAQRSVSGNQRRYYRLAVATTGEYGQYFSSSESLITSNIVTTINRVNQIYGRDLAVQLQLSAVVIFTNPNSDPYDAASVSVALLSKNQQILDFEVGTDSYDIGHLFGLSGGGLASLGVACASNAKAQGYTGHPTPVGDVFYIDFVAHELGHQLDATHSFNGTTLNCVTPNRYANTAVEPGSGSTIMAYAGICGGENLQSSSDATFHTVSIQQIHSFVFSGGGSHCGTLSATGNTAPTSNAGSDATIPQGTPFILTGSAADVDGDTLSYQWDEIDANGTATTDSTGAKPVGSDWGDNPLFRSFLPKSTPTRYFPKLSSLIRGVADIGETLPTTTRSLNFRMTVRDGNAGVADDDLAVNVDASQGPFQITGGVLNTAGTYSGETAKDLLWDPDSTSTSCQTVNISLLSLSNDGSTYCDSDDNSDLNLGDFPNTGVAPSVYLPSALISRARVMLKCTDNIFFDLSDQDISVVAASNPIPSDCKAIDGTPLEHGSIPITSPNITQSSSGGGGGGGLLWLPLLFGLGGLLRVFIRR